MAVPEDAESVLRTMSQTLASAGAFTVRGTRTADPGLVAGTNFKQDVTFAMTVQRPNKVQASTQDGNGVRLFFYDGSQVTVIDRSAKVYAGAPAPATIDAMVTQIDEKFGVHPPVADLIVSDPWASLSANGGSAKLAGTEKIGSVACQRVSASQPAVDWDIWIGEADHLPRKLVITFKQREGKPKLAVVLREWDLSPAITANQFTPVIPGDAQRVEMLPINQE